MVHNQSYICGDLDKSCDTSLCEGLVHGPFLYFAVFRGVRKPSDSSEESSEESDDECSDMPVTHSPIEPEAVTSTSSDSREEEASQRNRQVPRTTSSSGRDDEDISDTHVVTKLANKSISNKTLLVSLVGVVVQRKEFCRIY